MERILERIPTPPTSDGKYPIFPIPAIPLDEWITPEDKRLPEPTVTEEEIRAADIKEEHKGLAEGKGMICAQNLARAVEIGEKIGQATTVAIKETAGVLPFNSITIPAKVQPIIDNSTTPAKMYAPSLDPADFAFITGNTVTKVQIARAYAEEELSGWVYWYDVCGRQIEYWRSEIKALDESEKKLRESRENGMMFLKRLFEDQHKVEESKSRIDEVKRHSSIAARQLDRNIQQSPKPTIPPLHSTPTSQPLYVSWSNISDGSDQAPATATTQTNLLTALLAGGAGSNSPVLRGVGDLLVSSESMLLPALDIRGTVYEAGKSNNGVDEEMKDAGTGDSDDVQHN